MTPERWQKIETLFQSVLACAPGDRAAYLREACREDEVLRSELESLIASHEQANDFFRTPVFERGLKVFMEGSTDAMAGIHIGSYRIIKEIGRGGMGAVYLAERDDQQFKKRVAIKLIKRGMDTDAVLRRFRNERQILANLDHPNIAGLIDGGMTEDGLSYFVMEYIDGQPIDNYCDEKNLDIDRRLELFRQVCAAVQFAHQNLVVHRDLKPGNIMVTADGALKLLDFGIAKLLSSDRRMQPTDMTATALRVMTPEYASPEQIKGEPVTTATDVYSLGVLLYELLTGRRPYKLKERTAEEIEKAISTQEPVRPSQAVRETAFRVPTSVGFSPRDKSPTKVGALNTVNAKLLRGDLDNIVLKALRKEPQRRYLSVEQFSEDIRRHLEGLLVIARKDTFGYRTSKFIKRNKVLTVATMLVVLTLMGGGVATAWQARIAKRQAQIATEQRDRARVEAAKAERINAFMQNIFSYADPSWYSPGSGRGRDIKLVEALNEAAARIDTELADQPDVRAELHHTIGNDYRALGFYEKAEQHFRAALDLYRGIYGARHPKVAEALYYLAATLTHESDFSSATSLYLQAIEMMRAVDKDNVNLPYMLQDFGGLLVMEGNAAEAEPLLREALELFRARYGNEHITVRTTYERFAQLYETRGELDRAEAMYQRLLKGDRRADTLSALGRLYFMKGEYERAEGLLHQALDLAGKSLGENHPFVAGVLRLLARLHYLKHDYVKAEQEAGKALNIDRYTFSDVNPATVRTLGLLSNILIKAGKPNRAMSYLHEALESYRAAKDRRSSEWYGADLTIGEALTLLRRYSEAEWFLKEGYNQFKAHYGDQHPFTVEARQGLVQLYEAWGKANEAARYR